jgi:hypothetical protein
MADLGWGERKLVRLRLRRLRPGVGNALLFPNALSPMAAAASSTAPFASALASAASIERQPEPAFSRGRGSARAGFDSAD